MMIDELDRHMINGEEILDGGRSDGILYMDGTGEPIIIDFKRAMATNYPKRSFDIQTARFELIVCREMDLDVENFYTAIVQTPFCPWKLMDRAAPDERIYKQQVIQMIKVPL